MAWKLQFSSNNVRNVFTFSLKTGPYYQRDPVIKQLADVHRSTTDFRQHVKPVHINIIISQMLPAPVQMIILPGCNCVSLLNGDVSLQK